MKQVIKCAGCSKLVGLNGGRSFSVEINELMKDSSGKTVMVRTKAKICKLCTEDAGYATNRTRVVKPKVAEPTKVEEEGVAHDA